MHAKSCMSFKHGRLHPGASPRFQASTHFALPSFSFSSSSVSSLIPSIPFLTRQPLFLGIALCLAGDSRKEGGQRGG